MNIIIIADKKQLFNGRSCVMRNKEKNEVTVMSPSQSETVINALLHVCK